MTIAPAGLPNGLISRLEAYAAEHDFAELYRGYEWQRDNWRTGFPDILELEKQLTRNAKSNLVTRENVLAVAEWAKHRNPAGIQCPDVIRLPLKSTPSSAGSSVRTDAARLVTELRRATKGLGPTTLSKVLRFAIPREFGAIDTRIVRIVGQGDEGSKREHWLSLCVRNYGYGWYIALPQSAWPEEYSNWIGILRFIASILNDSGVACPHPEGFVTSGLRTRGIWGCADVETAFFSWASDCLAPSRSCPQ
jgi:hypothetical protein